MDRRNPAPKGKYDLVVVGAGTAGLVSAGGAAVLGARVALIERDKMGGDCLNTGCVPSKALIHEAREAWTRRQLAPGFDAKAFFREAVVATGGRPARPEIPGLEGVPYHTNESIFEIAELPDRLTVIGGGPIGCEMSQAFQRLGAQVTLIQRDPHILKKENEDASAVLTGQLMKEGVKVMLSAQVVSAQGSGGKPSVLVASDGKRLEPTRIPRWPGSEKSGRRPRRRGSEPR